MLYQGYYNGESNGELKLADGPIFKDHEKVFVYDVEDTVLEEVNGVWRVRDLAIKVVEHAVKHMDRVVAWSMNPSTLSMNGFPPQCEAHERLQDYPFSNIDQKIGGGVAVCKKRGNIYSLDEVGEEGKDNFSLIKNLRNLSNNLDNVVALEDKELYFDPLKCVIQYHEGDNFWSTYENAIYSVMAMDTRNGRKKKREIFFGKT